MNSARSVSSSLDEADHRGVGALRRGRDDAQVECITCVRGAGADSLGAADADGKRLARERRLVDHRFGADDDAVGGHHLAGADDDDVSGKELLHPHLFHGVTVIPMSDPRCALDEEA